MKKNKVILTLVKRMRNVYNSDVNEDKIWDEWIESKKRIVEYKIMKNTRDFFKNTVNNGVDIAKEKQKRK